MLRNQRFNHLFLILLFLPILLLAQNKPDSAPPLSDLQQILQRLERLELENRNLASEVRSLRNELAVSHTSPAGSATDSLAEASVPPDSSSAPDASVDAVPMTERMAVQERRTEELAQTKVEASQRFPVKLSGMVLFNSFLNGRAAGGFQDPLMASSTDSRASGGAGLSQSIIGLTFDGPRILGGGKVNGSVSLDLWGGTTTSSLNHLVRLRVATVSIDWKNQSISVGQDKPIISPREPTSLAQVAFSPLTAAGNLWLWQPQIRFEQRFAIGDNTGIRAQLGVYQTSEAPASAGSLQDSVAPARPALEGRFEFWRNMDLGNTGKSARIEIAPGFHISQTHVANVSIPSRLFSIDWLIHPFPKFELTGMFFRGTNAAGLGGLRQGFTIFDPTNIGSPTSLIAVRTAGGWAQFSYTATSRLSFNLFGGQESNPGSDLLAGGITRNLAYAANAIYHLGPNVLLGLEASQVRTTRLLSPTRLANHYDLALAYLF